MKLISICGQVFYRAVNKIAQGKYLNYSYIVLPVNISVLWFDFSNSYDLIL